MRVERQDGPTPAGGVYSEAIVDDDGRIVEIVEYDERGKPIARTYAAARDCGTAVGGIDSERRG